MQRHTRTPTLLLLAVLAAGCSGERPLGPDLELSFRRAEAPSALNLVVVAYDRIDVHWQDNSSNESGYELHRATGSSGQFTLLVLLPASSTAFGNSGLTAQTQYCYKVRAFRTTGKNTTYSEFSSSACATTAAVPSSLAPSDARAMPDWWARVAVSWTDNSPDEAGFRIERSATSGGPWTAVGTVSRNVMSFMDQQPPAFEQPACYRIIAFAWFGDSPASNVACTARPAAPSALEATASGSGADLTWTDNSNVEDGFQIVRWTDESQASVITEVAQIGGNMTTYHDAGLEDGKYWYQVRSMRDGGVSASSNNASVMIITRPPFTPSWVEVLPFSSTVTSVFFGDNSRNEEGFRIERSLDGGISWVAAGETVVDPHTTPLFNDGNQSSETQLCYRVIAFNTVGESAPSGVDCTALPLGPTNLTASGAGSGTIDLSWTDNSSVEDGYEINLVFSYCTYDELGQCVIVTEYYPYAIVGANTTSFQDTGLSPGENRTYIVFALKDGGRSDASNEVSALVP